MEHNTDLNDFIIFDEDKDGLIDNITKYKRNENGLISEIHIDHNNDGQTDCIIYFRYDEKGRIISELRDINMNGLLDTVKVYEYNADGNFNYTETLPAGSNINNSVLIKQDIHEVLDSLEDTVPNN